METTIKKTMNVANANGWYLAESAYRIWEEDFHDEDTGEVVTIERREVIAPVGDLLTPISISMLQENGITDVFVSDKQITGRQHKFMSLWQVEVVTLDPISGKDKSDYYIIPKGSPLECEVFFKEWAELNIKGGFTIKKVAPLDFSYALFPYEDEIEEAQNKHIEMRFYKVVIKSLTGSSRKVLTRADTLHTTESAIDAQYIGRDNTLDRISEIKEINIKKVFEDGINIAKYTLALYNPDITSHLVK